MIPIFKPSMGEEEVNAIREVINSGWIGLGPKTEEFEKKFASYIGTKYAVALNSCTAALHLAIKILNIEKDNEIITTPMTFCSTAFAINYNNQKPIFADIFEDTLNINPEDIKKKITAKTKAIIPVHYGGYACKIEEILEIAKEHNLNIIEDASHGTGSTYKRKKLGSFGIMGCFSFHAVKNLATADGGMITTNNKEFYERLKKLRWLGIDKSTFSRSKKEYYSWNYDIKEIGFKCHFNDILAAIGLIQLKKLDKMNKRRGEIRDIYNKEFENLDWIETPVEKKDVVSACHNYVCKVPKRNELIAHLEKLGISAGVHYKPLYLYPVYKNINVNCPITDRIWKKLITLPLFPDLTDEEINKVIGGVKSFKP